jgi:hypothetical protein
MNAKYVNHKGIEIPLTSHPYVMDIEAIFDWEYQYEATNFGDHGGKINRFYKDIATFEPSLYIHAETRVKFNERLRTFFDVTGQDIAAVTPGRILLDTEEYMLCYIYGTKKTWHFEGVNMLLDGLKIVSERPWWTKDIKFSFHGSSGGSGEDFLNYPYNYPYNYSLGADVQIIRNESAIASDFEMIVYGPITDPEIRIGSRTYKVNTVLYQGEYLKIDSRAKTIIHFKANGVEVNEFELREPSVFFVKIDPGMNTIQSNVFFDMVVYQERSEPLWNL